MRLAWQAYISQPLSSGSFAEPFRTAPVNLSLTSQGFLSFSTKAVAEGRWLEPAQVEER